MNKDLHRIVFNAARGMRMVVQETARSAGRDHTRRSGLGVALAALLGAAAAPAQIIGAPNVAGNQRPIILAAPNGVPLVNIQTPSAAGVSRNVYSRFDVQANGAILNNSRTNVQTQLGGYVQGNPYLATGPARVILNEINSGNPSQLRGYIEVAGQRAEVIVANSAGILVDGAGFLNASRATLTTGVPQLNAFGGLDGYRVSGGTISIDGKGLDLSQTDYAAIYARAMQVNAEIWAKDLKVVTGANQIGVDDAAITPIAGAGPAPAFALDVAALGGMYANKIVLVGNEAGLGVRNAGNIGAGVGGLVITAAGRLENTGTIEGPRIELASASDIDNRGGTIRQTGTAGLTLTAPILSNTQGGVVGAEPLSSGSSGSTGSTEGSGNASESPEGGTGGSGPGNGGPSSDTGSTGTNGGGVPPSIASEPAQPGTLSASGAILNDGGRIHAGGPITLQTPQINNAAGTINVADLSVSGPGFSNAAGTLNITRSFHADVGQFDNTGGTLNAGKVDITSGGDLLNVDGKITSAGDVILNAGGQLDNSRGTVSAPGALTASANSIDNTAGTFIANRDLQLSAQTVDNAQGSIRSAQGAAQVTTTGHLSNTGTISAATYLSVRASSLFTSGKLRGGESASVNVSGALVNDGSITAGGGTTVTAATLTSGHTGVLGAGVQTDGSLGTTGDLHIATSGALSANGTTVAAGNATLTGSSVDLSAGNIAAANLALTATQGDITTDAVTLETAGTLTVTATVQSGQALRNQDGHISAGTLDVNVANLANVQGGEILQTGADNARIAVAGTLDNTGGTIASNGAASVSAGALVNKGGKLFATKAASLDLSVAGLLDNQSGLISAGTHAGIQAARLNNDAGSIGSAGSLGATVSGAISNRSGGTIAAKGDVDLKAGSIDNTSGTISSQHDLRIVESGATLSGLQVVNAGGTIVADHDLSITTSGDLQNAGQLAAGNALRIASRDIDNTADGVIQGKTTAVAATGTVTNRGVIDGESTRIDAASIHNLGTGRIYGDRLSLGGGALVNEAETVDGATSAGTIAGRKRLDIGTASLDNRDGALILSGGDLFVGGSLDAEGHAIGTMGTLNNHAATIESIGNMEIAADLLNNTNGGVTWRMENLPTSDRVREYSVFGDDTHYDKSQLVFVYTALGDFFWPTFVATDDVLPPGSYTSVSNSYGIVIPSAAYPLDRFAYYYKNPPWNSVTLRAERPISIDQSETVELPGQWYAADDPIWSTFGVTPPPFDLPPDFPGKLGQSLTGEEEARWQTYLQAHGNLDVATRAFIDHVIGHFNIAYTVYEYTTSGTRPVLESSAPGRIVAGGSMKLAVGSGTNDMSQILAGSDLTGTGDNIRNINLEIAGTATRNGTMTVSTPSPDGRVFNIGGYDQVVPVTVTLAAARKQGNLGSVDSAARTEDRAPGQNAPDVNATGAGAPVNPIIQVQSSGDPSLAARTSLPSLGIPTASLFRTVDGGRYLIETDPRFANYRNWLGSDYLLNNLGLDPNNTLKRLGDGFYEQKLIREQIAQLTGYRYLDGYTSDEAQYAALMDAGVAFAQQYHLTPGIALADAQMAQLTSDIVWLVEQRVTLPDGSTQRVLVPQVYVRVKPGDIDGSGALIAADKLKLDMQGDVTTSGTIAGRKAVSITAENIGVLNGQVSGDKVGLKARNDIDIVGGTVDAGSVAILEAGRDLNVRSTTSSGSTSSIRPGAISQGSATLIDRVAGIYVSKPEGVLLASAGNDVNLVAARVVNTGEGGATGISAGHDIHLGTVTTGSANSAVWGPGNSRAEASTQEVGTQILANGDIGLYAKNDINARAANVTSVQGDVTLAALHDVNIEAGQSTSSLDQRYYRKDKSTFESQTVNIERQVDRTQAIGSEIGGRTVTIVAGNDIGVKGSNVVSDKGTTLVAGHDVNIESVTETTSRYGQSEIKKSGVFSSGSAITFGKEEQQSISRTNSTSAAGSTIGSIGGNVNIVAGNRYSQVGSDVVAPGGDVNILAKDVRITEARETSQTHTEQRYRQSGVSVGVSSPLLDAARTVADLAEASGQTDSGRMQALSVAAGGAAAYNGMHTQAAANAKAADSGSSSPIAGKFTVTAGSSRSQSTSDQATNTAKGSSFQAGGDVNIIATGAGAESNILIQGSNVGAGHNVNLAADNKIELLAAQNTTSRSSSSSSSGWYGGLGFSSGTQNGMTFEAGANTGKATSQGSGTYWTNTHITAGNQVNMISGGDTTLRGAVVSADQVNALVGGNLTIQSLQDTSINSAKQSGGGASMSLCVYMCYGESYVGANAYNTHANGNYASVTEQSGIKAGDGGFNVHVAGNTNLIGGVIESTQAAIDQAKNSFSTKNLTTSDIANVDVQTGGGWSASLGSNGNSPGTPTAGLSGINESQESVTRSGISGIAGDQSVRTGDTNSVGALANRWNEQQVMNDLSAQQQIMQEFNRQAPAAVKTYADEKTKAYEDARRELNATERQVASSTDPAERAALTSKAESLQQTMAQNQEAYDKWKDGGNYRAAVNILVAAASGETVAAGAAITRESLVWAANQMREAMVEDSKKFPGVCDTQGNCLDNKSGLSIGSNGDGFKLAGGRVDLENLCTNEMCQVNADGSLKLDSQGRVQMKAFDGKGNPISLPDLIAANPDWRSPLGGFQGTVGKFAFLGDYAPGSLQDILAEAYAGTHDMLNSKRWYGPDGNIRPNMTNEERAIGEAMNKVNVLLATPFALASLLPPEILTLIVLSVK
ncbi:filamentous hemagglutinin [Variovorax sp. HW608]|uniref:hemagglutinin repeat-containing protein n=1 Tax=Variovorax sp. HW608 TaxID=1034889 RepID=UPI00081FAC6C|nr:hemagglutinin repeat-containing protein [Variovorax sp. HW608]SCK21901.1 filamentous hemagglutinin [Variovorax sp. HW608]